jgi:hypothetical protein
MAASRRATAELVTAELVASELVTAELVASERATAERAASEPTQRERTRPERTASELFRRARTGPELVGLTIEEAWPRVVTGATEEGRVDRIHDTGDGIAAGRTQSPRPVPAGVTTR